MNFRLPIRVGLMDDDFFALKWNAGLLARDLRTEVLFESESPKELLRALRSCEDIETLLLDVEYNFIEPPLPDLIQSINRIHPQLAIVCLSQYGDPEHIHAAITTGARGFLLKRDIRMEIGSALVQALQVDFLITPGVLPLIKQDFARFASRAALINPWSPNPGLTPKLNRVFTLKILYGMSAPLAAQEIHLAPSTVEKYIRYAYQKLSTQWGDEQYLAGINLDDQPPEVRAFHRFNLPPKESVRLRQSVE